MIDTETLIYLSQRLNRPFFNCFKKELELENITDSKLIREKMKKLVEWDDNKVDALPLQFPQNILDIFDQIEVVNHGQFLFYLIKEVARLFWYAPYLLDEPNVFQCFLMRSLAYNFRTIQVSDRKKPSKEVKERIKNIATELTEQVASQQEGGEEEIVALKPKKGTRYPRKKKVPMRPPTPEPKPEPEPEPEIKEVEKKPKNEEIITETLDPSKNKSKKETRKIKAVKKKDDDTLSLNSLETDNEESELDLSEIDSDEELELSDGDGFESD